MFTNRVFISIISLGMIFSTIILYMSFNIQISPYKLGEENLTYRAIFELLGAGFYVTIGHDFSIILCPIN